MKSIHEFVDYLSLHLGMVRNMKFLARDEAFFKEWDRIMGERWVSVINGNSPTPRQRAAALEERANVTDLFPRLQPALKDLLARCHSLHAYAMALPPPPQAAGGWDVRGDLLHPDRTVEMLGAAIKDVKAIHHLDQENAFFKSLFDQVLEMARWTRTSLNPAAEDRAKVHLGELTQARLDEQFTAVLTKVCRSMHDFCALYANFPTREAPPKIELGPLEFGK